MRTQVHYRYVLLLVSFVILVLLRNNILILSAYVVAVIGLVAFWAFALPRMVARAEKRFEREALRLLARRDLRSLQVLAARQGLIRRFGQKHVLPSTLALGAQAAGDHASACRLLKDALSHAPQAERARLEINLANAELATGQLDAAEMRFRAILRKRSDLVLARTNLARTLLAKGESLGEAIELLQASLDQGDGRAVEELRLLLAEAREALANS